MFPFILAVAGGYLIGQSQKQLFDHGGRPDEEDEKLGDDGEPYTDPGEEIDRVYDEMKEKSLNEYLDRKDRGEDFASGGKVKGFEVELYAVPNVDYDESRHQGRVNIPPKKYKVSTLEKASKLVRKFIEENDLGGGNFPQANLFKDGRKIGYVSYNGRVWDSNGNPMI